MARLLTATQKKMKAGSALTDTPLPACWSARWWRDHLLAPLMSHSFADFYRGKRVLVTGHTGFEGGWTAAWLKFMGAQVCGFGLPPATRPNFFDATILDRGMTSVFGDIRDRNSLASTFTEIQPEIVIHCAARTSPQSCLREPVDAFSINVMGTVHILEEARLTHSVGRTF